MTEATEILQEISRALNTWLRLKHKIAPRHIKADVEALDIDVDELDIHIHLVISLPLKLED